jgi:hypothetical protein
MSYQILKGLEVHRHDHPAHRSTLIGLVKLAKQMEVGDAVLLRSSEAQTFRIILAALDFRCVTDGWNSSDPTRVLAFKLAPEPELPDFRPKGVTGTIRI